MEVIVVQTSVDQLDDIHAAGRFLNVSPMTVRRLVKRGELRPVRIGTRLLFRRDDLEALVARGGAPTKP